MRVIKTQESIEAAFNRLIETTEYTGITVSALAREAHISRKTFYSHYASIDDLLRHLARKSIDEVARAIQPEGELLTTTEWINEFTRTTLANLRDNPHLSNNVLRCMPMSSILDMLHEPLLELCRKEVAKRGLSPTHGYDCYLIFFVGGLSSVYESWLRSGNSVEELDEAGRLIGNLVAGGIDEALSPA